MAPKILVIGAVQGQLRRAFEKMAKFHAKNDFSFSIVVGDLFTQSKSEDLEHLLNGSLVPPLTIYFTTGDTPLPAEVIDRLNNSEINEVVPNLIYLGRKGTIKTSDGIRLVALGGSLLSEGTAGDLGKHDPFYRLADARGLHGAHEADILITNQWPSQIVTGSHIPLPQLLRSEEGSQPISDLCSALKPRYHFSSSPTASWEREPFIQGDSSQGPQRLTRFRSLAAITNSVKEWICAFSLDPQVQPPATTDTTLSPFRVANPRKRGSLDTPEGEFNRYASREGGNNSTRPVKRHRGQRQNRSDDCFMCVNRPEFKKHMLVSIGDESLVTIPKGPLPVPSTFPELSASGHALIIPIYHAADDSIKGPRPTQEVEAEFAEMTKYRKALCKMVMNKSNGHLGAVCWEANRTGIRHCHWQFMPVSTDLIEKGLVEAGFRAYREKNEYPAFKTYDADSRLEEKSDYFRVWIWTPQIKGVNPVDNANKINSEEGDEGKEKSIYFPLPMDQKFNIWFGREVMASLLQLEDRINWMDAEQSFELESQDAQTFREDFAEFDFAMA